jgi:ketosteroid isomerase-like protein
LATVLDLVDPNIEIDLSRNVFNPDVYRGQAGVEKMLTVIEDVWDDFHIETTDLIDAGDTVVAAVTIRGEGKGSGVETEMQLFQIWTFRDSKAVRMVGGYRNRSEALEAAGLPEQIRPDSPERR